MEPTPTAPIAKKDYSALYLPLAIIFAGVLIAGGLYMGLSSKGVAGAPAGGPGQKPDVAVNIKDVKIDAGTPFIGKADAPAMAYWSDYQCPFCKQFELNAMATIIKTYVDTGKLKIVFKDFAFLGEDSVMAGKYGHAIWTLYPAQYFAWREAMYKAQDGEGDQGFGDAASIDKLSKGIAGIDAAKVATYVKAHDADLAKEVQNETTEGSAFGVNGTPGFIIGTKRIDGSVPLAQFTAAIGTVVK